MLSPGRYILDANWRPVPEPNLLKWAKWLETANRQVALDKIGGGEISTVFLGLDHNWPSGPPVLWETMVFGGELNHAQARCAGNREQAEAMHAEVVQRVKAAETTNK